MVCIEARADKKTFFPLFFGRFESAPQETISPAPLGTSWVLLVTLRAFGAFYLRTVMVARCKNLSQNREY